MHNIMHQRASVSTDKGPLTLTSDCEFHYIVETTFCSTVEGFSCITTYMYMYYPLKVVT